MTPPPGRVTRIYGLRTSGGVIRYVGHTTMKTIQKRLYHHGWSSRHGSPLRVHQWIRDVGLENVEPIELEQCEYADRYPREEFWTLKLGTLVADGGLNDSLGVRPSEASRAKTGATQTGRTQSASHRAATSAANRRSWATPEGRAKRLPILAQGLHVRWHENRGVTSDECVFCYPKEESA